MQLVVHLQAENIHRVRLCVNFLGARPHRSSAQPHIFFHGSSYVRLTTVSAAGSLREGGKIIPMAPAPRRAALRRAARRTPGWRVGSAAAAGQMFVLRATSFTSSACSAARMSEIIITAVELFLLLNHSNLLETSYRTFRSNQDSDACAPTCPKHLPSGLYFTNLFPWVFITLI